MHGTEGKRLDRVTGTWMDAAAYDAMQAQREEAVFMRRARQGELCAPMVINDGMDGVQSQTDGKVYDSKHALRREYRRAGVIEVGNDVKMKRDKPTRDEKDRNGRAIKDTIGRAFNRVGLPTA
jgi:hypothetical protein